MNMKEREQGELHERVEREVREREKEVIIISENSFKC